VMKKKEDKNNILILHLTVTNAIVKLGKD